MSSESKLPKNYLFADEDGNNIELCMTFEDLRKRQFKKDGVRGDFIIHRDEELKRLYPPFGTSASSVWPKRSMAIGVGVHQIEEARKADMDHGINVEYCPKTGDAIHTSMKHRKKHLKLLNMVDRDSYC